MSAYQPQIASRERVQEEFETAATKFAEAARAVYTPEDLEGTLASLRDKVMIATYTQHLPLVHRFVVAEMDTDAPSKRGIGRLADGDPPPGSVPSTASNYATKQLSEILDSLRSVSYFLGSRYRPPFTRRLCRRGVMRKPGPCGCVT